MVRLFVLFALMTLVSSASHGAGETISTAVKSERGLTCKAYLHVADEKLRDLPLFVGQAGTGVYTNSTVHNLDPFTSDLIKKKLAAVLVIDKPGIIPDPTNKDDGARAEEPYYRYIADDLVSCLDSSISWAVKSHFVSEKRGIALNGHSEGAIAMVSLYQQSLKRNAKWASHVKFVMLSGVPLMGMDSIIGLQFGAKRLGQFWQAIEKKDDKLMRELLNMGLAYWANAVAQPSLRERFATLADLKPAADFAIFQGMGDGNTPFETVIEFERWNDILKKRDPNGTGKSPPLKLGVRYYNAGHYLNTTAMDDMLAAWKQRFL